MNKSLKLLALSLPVMGLYSCNSHKVYTRTVYAFSTFIELKISASNEKILDEAENTILYFNEITDAFEGSKKYNNVYDINHTNLKTEVTKELYDVLFEADRLKEETSNCYSPYLFNLSSLYKKELPKGNVPTASEVAALLEEANNTSLEFVKESDKYFVTRKGNGSIDLGGIAKGACLDALYDLFKVNNLTYYLVSAQSSILMGGKDYSPSEFKVAIKDKPGYCFKLKNCGLATSGISEQLYKIGDKTYSHILDPRTGSAEAKRTAAIVKGESNMNAKLDAYSTALMNMSDVEISKFVEDRHLGAYIIDNQSAVSFGLEAHVI